MAKPSEKVLDGRGLQIVSPKPDHTFELDERSLAELLDSPDVRNRSVVLVAVAGAFRKGKSFLLDFFLRYLHHTYVLNSKDDNWLGPEDEPLQGFGWRGGSERHTTGLLLWSKPFKATLHNGEKVAIFLMDTQGTFDSESTVRDNATVFALSTMISSVLVYNLSQNIEEDELQHLQLFTDYGRVALEKTEGKPFQHLQFLVRDWSVPYEYPYGLEGGNKLLEKRLEVHENQHEELKTLRREIRSFFSQLSCFLMPHPGMKVATSKEFNGKLTDIDEEFKKCLKELVPYLLAPQNLQLKVLSGQTLKAKELLYYIKAYMEVFNGTELPVPQTILEATAQANNLSAVSEAREVYEGLMEEVAGGARPYLPPPRLAEEHRRARDKALHCFSSKKKMGGDAKADTYREQLVQELEEQFDRLRAQNESKSLLNIIGSGVVFGALLVAGCVLSMLGDALAFTVLEVLGQALALLALGALAVWMYSRFTGHMREASEILDEFAITLRNYMLQNLSPSGSLPAAVTTTDNQKRD
ncbi:PREDICTED: atlastin-like [Papilio polytes]|uniref:atlastin-like n=1 Tax=Papilio polytes TaxID=76194 RepID=UPI000676823B|nr:PREDICTED: atlastin-like [Papilio polytes]